MIARAYSSINLARTDTYYGRFYRSKPAEAAIVMGPCASLITEGARGQKAVNHNSATASQ